MARKSSLKSKAVKEQVASRFVSLEDPEKITGAAAVPTGVNKGTDVKKYRSVYVRLEVEKDKEKQRQLASLDTSFGLSFAEYELMLPHENRAGNDVTHGGAAMCFYYDHFVSGFRLPLSAFAVRVCEGYRVCPMQWTPNS